MDDVRPLSELYKLVLKELKNPIQQYSGICSIISELFRRKIITIDELLFLRIDFKNRRPTKNSIFYWDPLFYKNTSEVYWWTPGKAFSRKLFLKYLIRKTKQK